MAPWYRLGSLWYHPACALDVNLADFADALRRAPNDEDLEPLRARVRARVKAINASKRARKGVSFKVASVDAIEATCDLEGRPRVTVAYFGSMASGGEAQPNPLRDFARDDVVRTARREYMFELFTGAGADRLAIDPSRPLVGAVFAVFANRRLVKAQRDKLALLRAFGVRSPILWLIGAELADPVVRDAKVLELREALQSAGFEGDESVAVCSAVSSAAALEELGAALDDLDHERPAPLRLDERFERAVIAIETALEERADHSLAALIEALPVARAKIDTLDQRAISALLRCVTVAAARTAALLRLRRWSVVEHRAPLLDALRAALIEPGRGAHPDVEHLLALLGDGPDPALFDAFASALEHAANKSPTRALALQRVLASCDDDAISERVARWARGLKASDKRKLSAAALATTIGENAARRRANSAGAP